MFPLKDRKDVDLGGRRGREELGRVRGEEIIIRIRYMKNYFP